MTSAFALQFTPWAAVNDNISALHLTHPIFNIPPPGRLNQTILHNLDTTFSTVDDQLTRTLDTMNTDIDKICETPDTLATYLGSVALALSILS